jgi:hypothetical protein
MYDDDDDIEKNKKKKKWKIQTRKEEDDDDDEEEEENLKYNKRYLHTAQRSERRIRAIKSISFSKRQIKYIYISFEDKHGT